MSEAYEKKKDENPDYHLPVVPLNERPGLQRITYTAIFDYRNND
jgi:hypothetical protein